jgi:hypothetical protein
MNFSFFQQRIKDAVRPNDYTKDKRESQRKNREVIVKKQGAIEKSREEKIKSEQNNNSLLIFPFNDLSQPNDRDRTDSFNKMEFHPCRL